MRNETPARLCPGAPRPPQHARRSGALFTRRQIYVPLRRRNTLFIILRAENEQNSAAEASAYYQRSAGASKAAGPTHPRQPDSAPLKPRPSVS